MKTRNLTQSSLRNDPINRWMHGFSFHIFEDKIEVQDVISPRSLDQIQISSIPWMRKRVKKMKKSNDTRIGCLDNLNFLKIQGRNFHSRRIVYLKGKIGRKRLMKECIAINSHNLFDQNGAIKLHLYDQRWSTEMNPRL